MAWRRPLNNQGPRQSYRDAFPRVGQNQNTIGADEMLSFSFKRIGNSVADRAIPKDGSPFYIRDIIQLPHQGSHDLVSLMNFVVSSGSTRREYRGPEFLAYPCRIMGNKFQFKNDKFDVVNLRISVSIDMSIAIGVRSSPNFVFNEDGTRFIDTGSGILAIGNTQESLGGLASSSNQINPENYWDDLDDETKANITGSPVAKNSDLKDE